MERVGKGTIAQLRVQKENIYQIQVVSLWRKKKDVIEGKEFWYNGD